MSQNSKSTSSPTCVKAFPAFFNIHLSKYMHILRHLSSAFLVSPPPRPALLTFLGNFPVIIHTLLAQRVTLI